MLTVNAPAKLNLALEVLGERPDGYHEVRSVMQAVSLCDTIHFTGTESLIITCQTAGWSAGSSLVSRTVNILREATGSHLGARIDIEKRVPLLSGLGGDSSDAAAVLRGLNQLWNLNLAPAKLAELARKLGSDVPFFLRGGTALAVGRGEIISLLPPFPKAWFVIVVPDIPRLPGKTARMYATLDLNHFTDGSVTKGLVAGLREGKGLADLCLFNAFENVADDVFPGLKTYRDHLLKLGADSVHLAGSGPALFSLTGDEARARNLHRRCTDQHLDAYLAEGI